jgi:hypothetical protein
MARATIIAIALLGMLALAAAEVSKDLTAHGKQCLGLSKRCHKPALLFGAY